MQPIVEALKGIEPLQSLQRDAFREKLPVAGELTEEALEQCREEPIIRSSLGVEAEHELLDRHYTALATNGVFGVAWSIRTNSLFAAIENRSP